MTSVDPVRPTTSGRTASMQRFSFNEGTIR